MNYFKSDRNLTKNFPLGALLPHYFPCNALEQERAGPTWQSSGFRLLQIPGP